jgi:hypothetical protein
MCHFSERRADETAWEYVEESEPEGEPADQHPDLEAERDVEVELITDGGDED